MCDGYHVMFYILHDGCVMWWLAVNVSGARRHRVAIFSFFQSHEHRKGERVGMKRPPLGWCYNNLVCTFILYKMFLDGLWFLFQTHIADKKPDVHHTGSLFGRPRTRDHCSATLGLSSGHSLIQHGKYVEKHTNCFFVVIYILTNLGEGFELPL